MELDHSSRGPAGPHCRGMGEELGQHGDLPTQLGRHSRGSSVRRLLRSRGALRPREARARFGELGDLDDSLLRKHAGRPQLDQHRRGRRRRPARVLGSPWRPSPVRARRGPRLDRAGRRALDDGREGGSGDLSRVLPPARRRPPLPVPRRQFGKRQSDDESVGRRCAGLVATPGRTARWRRLAQRLLAVRGGSGRCVARLVGLARDGRRADEPRPGLREVDRWRADVAAKRRPAL